MKNLITILSISLILFSCEKRVASKSVDNNAANLIKKQFVVDSVKVGDSVMISKFLTTSFNKQLLVFPTIGNKTILDSIYQNAGVISKSYDAVSLKNVLTQEMKTSFSKTKESLKDYSPDFKQTWDDTSAMKLVYHKNDLLTIQYTGSGFSGGAHGYYFENYKTFDLKNNKVITQKDIFKNPDDSSWSQILMAHFDHKEQRENLLVDKISLNNNFFTDGEKITFVYNQYEIAPYAAGVVTITMKFDEIKDKLNADFLKRYHINTDVHF